MRLIDADVLCDNHTRLAYESNYDFHITARAWVEKQPTIDAVPVVRCKDCKYWNPANDDSIGERCELLAALLNPNEDDYCSCGERKDDHETERP